MKKTLLISVLLLLTASFTFAQGFNGKAGANNFQRYHNMGNIPGMQREIVTEIVEITGKITLQEDSYPTIKSGKNDLDLLIGPAVIETLKLKNGDTVTVKGIKVPGPNWTIDEKSAVRARELTVNGKTYLVMGGGRINGGGPGQINGTCSPGYPGPMRYR